MVDSAFNPDPNDHRQLALRNSNALEAYTGYAGAQTGLIEDEIDLREIWRTLVRYRKIIFIVFLIFALTALISSLLMRPVYTATSTVEINIGNGELLDVTADDNRGWVDPNQVIQNQINIFTSEQVANLVIDRLNLEDVPEFNGELRQRGVGAGISAIKQLLSGADDTSTVDDESTRETIRSGLIGAFRANLSVSPIRNSHLVAISFNSFDPELSADIVNAVTDAFVTLEQQRRIDSTSGAREFLENQIVEVQARLETSEQRLTEYARKNGVVDLENRENILVSRLAELNDEYARTQNARINLESQYQHTLAEENRETLPVVLEDSLIEVLKQQYAELQAEYYELSEIYKDKYPRLVQLRARMDDVRSSIDNEINRVVNGLESEFRQAESREKLLYEQLERQKVELLDTQERAVAYNILKREWEANKDLYTELLDGMKKVGVAAGLQLDKASIVDRARTPLWPSSPRVGLNVAIASVLGLMFGAGLAFLLAFLDRTIKNPDRLQELVGIPTLGLIPHMDSDMSDKEISFASHLKPGDSFAESFRSLRTSLMYALPDGMPKSVMITSSNQGEGKSTAAINLAITIAKSGRSVLLIDLDLRKPSVHTVLGIPNVPGVSDAIIGNKPPSLYAIKEIDGLSVLVSGTTTPNPTELLASRQFDRLVKGLEDQYDVLVFDSPPVLGLADAVIISQKAEAVLYAVSCGRTTTDMVKSSINRMRIANAPLIGTLMTNFDLDNPDYNYYGAYYYSRVGDEEEQASPADEKLAETPAA